MLMRKRDYYKKQSVEYNSGHHCRLYQAWKLINSLTGRSSKSKHINEVDNKTFRDDENISEAFNEFFINISSKLALEVTNPSINQIETFLEEHLVTIPSLHFTFIPVENVLKTLRHLN